MEATPRFPRHRPADIPFDVWVELAKNPHCSKLLECGGTPCQPIDSDGYYDVHVDHVVSRHRGGESTLENTRVVCKCYNLKKGPRTDPDFARSYYFDRPIDTTKLREHQLQRAYNIPQRTYRDLFRDRYSEVLGYKILLFSWLMGAGKTIGVCAFLFAVNHLRMQFAARRVRRVLWMVHHVALVELIAKELAGDNRYRSPALQSELVKYGIVDEAPSVFVPRNTDQLFARPRADIVCVPIESIWDVEKRQLTTEQRREFLAGFDAIIIDEAHFGIERYLEIMKAAQHALKICLTATPMDRDGNFLSEIDEGRYKQNFVLVSSYGYHDGIQAGIYKELLEFGAGKKERHYRVVKGGDAEIAQGEEFVETVNPSHPLNVHRTMALANEAVDAAVKLDSINGGPNLIMMRFDAREKARIHAAAMNDDPRIGQHGAIAVYAGIDGIARLSNPRNPWMLVHEDAKLHNVRFLLCVNLGQIGLNNRFCSIIAWRDMSNSMIEIIQRIGRAMRTMRSNDVAKEKVYLIWRDTSGDNPAVNDPKAHTRFEQRLERSLNYILNLPEQLLEKFVTLADFVQPADIEPIDVDPTLPLDERIRLLSIAGAMPEAEPDAIITAFEAAHETPSGDGRLEAVKNFIDTVIYPPEDDAEALIKSQRIRAAMLGAKLSNSADQPTLPLPAQPTPTLAAIQFVREEAPPDTYPLDRLLSAIDDFFEFSAHPDYWKNELQNDNKPVQDMISQRLKQHDLAAFQPPQLIWLINEVMSGIKKKKNQNPGETDARGIPPTAIAKTFAEKYFYAAGLPDTQPIKSMAASYVNRAAAKLMGLKNLKETRPHIARYHVHIVDALLEPRNQQLIRKLALRLFLTEKGRELTPGLYRKFQDILEQLPDLSEEDEISEADEIGT